MIYSTHTRAEAHAELDRLFAEDKRVIIKAEPTSRSYKQNALMWMWLQCISDEMSRLGNRYSKEAIYHYYLNKFPTYRSEGLITWTVTSSKFTKPEMKAFLDNIQEDAATEFEITLPNPEDREWDAFKNYYENKI